SWTTAWMSACKTPRRRSRCPTGKELDAWAETMSRSLGAQGHPGHDGAPAVEPWRPWGAQGGQEGAGPSTEAPCVHKGLLEVGAPGAR
ncbi:unnamed protein product, partial [Prorocentrum cordatum]